MKQQLQTKTRRVRRPLAVKLIGITSLIIVVAMTAVTGLATWFFAQDSRVRAEEQNLVVSEMLAFQMESEVQGIYSSALSLLDTVREFGSNRALERIAVSNYFIRSPEVAYIGVPGEKEFFNSRFLSDYEMEQGVLTVLLANREAEIERAALGESLLLNASPGMGLPAALLAVPYKDMGSDSALTVVFSSEKLQNIVQTNTTNLTYAVTAEGDLLAHPDFELVKLGVNMQKDPLVAQALSRAVDNLQILYEDADGESYYGAFRKIDLGQFAAASSIPADLVNAAAYAVIRQNLYLTAIVLLLSMLAVWFFSKTVTRPVMSLVHASRQIEEGQFELTVKPTTRDELGLLTESFVQMGHGLAERERIKDTFGKFVNKEVAEQAAQGDLKLGGTRRTATIFFSDIRSFTAISEKLAPEAVVEFLNQYMTRMVSCIEETRGVVDKFIGDAIMAVWGAPLTLGTPEEDAMAAIRAMLMMRESLREFNQDRGSDDKPVINIGCGVNTGPCLAGQIGSAQRMEYTVIGDAVNLASRIEALNKPFATDILISEYTYQLVKDQIIAQAMPAIKVKGKTDPLTIYAVINLKDTPGPQTLDEVRRLLGIQPPSRIQAPDESEVKYEIID